MERIDPRTAAQLIQVRHTDDGGAGPVRVPARR